MNAVLNIAAPDSDAAGARVVRELCRKQSRGLFLASFLLPKPKRDAVYAISAFGGLLHQAIDKSSCADDSLQGRLDLFRARLDEIYEGRFELPAAKFRDQTQHILAAFSHAVERYEIPRQHFVDWAEGLRMDRTVRRYATWSSLQKYCCHSGGVIALVLSCILGLQNSDGGKYAVSLGNAIRLTHILANLKKDWQREHLYLPLEDMARFGYAERELAAGIITPAFRQLMKFEIERARELYRAGAEGICWLADDGSRTAASLIAIHSESILKLIEQQDHDVFHGNPRPGMAQTLVHLTKAWSLARRSPDQPLPRMF